MHRVPSPLGRTPLSRRLGPFLRTSRRPVTLRLLVMKVGLRSLESMSPGVVVVTRKAKLPVRVPNVLDPMALLPLVPTDSRMFIPLFTRTQEIMVLTLLVARWVNPCRVTPLLTESYTVPTHLLAEFLVTGIRRVLLSAEVPELTRVPVMLPIRFRNPLFPV